ncbi:hypothetical protein [Halorubrum sp. T3]|uniref:hypothetical protein n=1 Tax=Halorubrum sp. T3 TaxID=1194088 RepID=UPI0003698EEE|nr:hypothetical protein [Halorubrum sp. T3]
MTEHQTGGEIELTWRDAAEDVLTIAWELITLAALPTLITLVAWPGVERIFVDTYLVGTPLNTPLAPITGPAAVLGTWVGLMYVQIAWIDRHKTTV